MVENPDTVLEATEEEIVYPFSSSKKLYKTSKERGFYRKTSCQRLHRGHASKNMSDDDDDQNSRVNADQTGYVRAAFRAGHHAGSSGSTSHGLDASAGGFKSISRNDCPDDIDILGADETTDCHSTTAWRHTPDTNKWRIQRLANANFGDILYIGMVLSLLVRE